MTNFKKIKSMSIEELSKWIDEYCVFDNSPWVLSFDEKYCSHCEPVSTSDSFYLEAPCENGECKFGFKNISCVDMVRMWLEEDE